MNLRRPDRGITWLPPHDVPDSPAALAELAETDALNHCQTLAIDAARAHPGNQQTVQLARTVAGAVTVAEARTAVCAALAGSKTNRPLQNLALDVYDRLVGL